MTYRVRTTLERALALAVERHAGQRDKAGEPYILHPLRIMLRMPDEACRLAAILHDVVEDTATTLAELEALGVAGEALEAVALLTHDPRVPYLDYVRRLRPHRVARTVKRADLLDNLDMARLPEPTVEDRRRLERYRAALVLLDDGEAHGGPA
jgi:hypothetical protein